jgi:hypothetical protein
VIEENMAGNSRLAFLCDLSEDSAHSAVKSFRALLSCKLRKPLTAEIAEATAKTAKQPERILRERRHQS